MPGSSKRSRSARTSSVIMPEILGDERHLAELRAQRRQQRLAAAVPPLAYACGPRPRGNLPVRLERAEVVDAHEVETRELRTHARRPTSGSRLRSIASHVVERIAPELAVGVEVVGRNAGHAERLAARIEREQRAAPTKPRRCCDRRRTASRRTNGRRARWRSASTPSTAARTDTARARARETPRGLRRGRRATPRRPRRETASATATTAPRRTARSGPRTVRTAGASGGAHARTLRTPAAACGVASAANDA